MAEATTGHTRLRVGHAWSAMGRHTPEFQRRWAARYPDVELHLVRTNSATGGLSEGTCDLAVVRTAVDEHRFASAVVGHERRYCALAADDPWARRRSIALAEVGQRTLLIDRRTGTTTPELWPDGIPATIEYTQDIDDWLAVIATGRSVGITTEGAITQYRRDGIVFRPLRDAPPVAVQLIGAATTRTPPPTRPSPCSPSCTRANACAPPWRACPGRKGLTPKPYLRLAGERALLAGEGPGRGHRRFWPPHTPSWPSALFRPGRPGPCWPTIASRRPTGRQSPSRR